MTTVCRISKEGLALYRDACKKQKVSVKGLMEWVGENLDSLEIDWDAIRIDNPSNGIRWKRVKDTVLEVSKITKNRKELLARCAARGLTEKQVVAAIRILNLKC